jgi:hypothetical protein
MRYFTIPVFVAFFLSDANSFAVGPPICIVSRRQEQNEQKHHFSSRLYVSAQEEKEEEEQQLAVNAKFATLSEQEKQNAVGNLVADDEWLGLSMELSELVRVAVVEDLKKNTREFLGKEDYKVGDITKQIDTRVKEEVAKFRGKDGTHNVTWLAFFLLLSVFQCIYIVM